MDTVLNCDAGVCLRTKAVVEQLLADGVLSSAVYRMSVPSTSTEALDWVQTGEFSESSLPRLFLADQQSAGRGRHGNTWQSETESGRESDSLTLSVVIPRVSDAAFEILSPAVGVAAAKAIEFVIAPRQIHLKWPNDLCCLENAGGEVLRKLGGILIETNAAATQCVVIGLGINLNQVPRVDSRTLFPPTSLADYAEMTIDRPAAMAAVIESLMETLSELQANPQAIVEQYRSRCALTNKQLTMMQGNQVVSGLCTGMLSDGSLEIIDRGQRAAIRTGEVKHVRPL